MRGFHLISLFILWTAEKRSRYLDDINRFWVRHEVDFDAHGCGAAIP